MRSQSTSCQPIAGQYLGACLPANDNPGLLNFAKQTLGFFSSLQVLGRETTDEKARTPNNVINTATYLENKTKTQHSVCLADQEPAAKESYLKLSKEAFQF